MRPDLAFFESACQYFLAKVAQIFDDFWAIFGKKLAAFISTSGHTAANAHRPSPLPIRVFQLTAC